MASLYTESATCTCSSTYVAQTLDATAIPTCKLNAQNPLDTFHGIFTVDGKVANLLPNCYGLVTDLLRGSYGKTDVIDFGV